MNPLRWLLELSARAANARAGTPAGAQPADTRVDAREYEAWIDVDGCRLLVTNLKSRERWRELSADATRLARITEDAPDCLRLMVYERRASGWTEWEGPSLLATLSDAIALGRQLLTR